MMKQIKGITLIALIVTIIILLILAGVTIITLTGENGLINKITIARKKHLESEAEEKLKLKIMELQTDIVNKEGREAVLDDLNNWINPESDYYNSEIASVTDSQENTNKLVEINGYIFEVDENLNIISIIDSNKISTTETTYQVNYIDEDVMQVTIKIKNTLGIEKVITPGGKEIIPQGDKKQIGIDYEVTSGNNYTFIVKVSGSDEIKEYVLKADINAKPEIDQNESYAYPLLTEYGVEINKTVEIDYGENINNYYSIDNGNTWHKYTDKIKIQEECTLIAKTITEGEITRENKKQILLQLAQDALPPQCYDGDEQTTAGYGKIFIDEKMINKKIKVILTYYTNVTIYNQNDESIFYKYIDGVNSITIPENSKYIILSVGENKQTISEILIANEPKINITSIYPEITADGIKQGYNQIEIEYFSTSKQRLYKIDNKDWEEYQDSKINLELGETIYTKGIDRNGKETPIVEYKSKLAQDALPGECYDGNEKTYGEEGLIYIDQSMYNMSIKIKVNYYNEIYIYNQNDELLDSKFTGGVNRRNFINDSTKYKIYKI